MLPLPVLRELDEKADRSGFSRRLASKPGGPTLVAHEELVEREQKRRANKAFTRAKQLWIWTVALGFSYADLVGTVFVGMEYWAIRTEAGRHAARVTFGMVAGSLAFQAWFSFASGQGTQTYRHGNS